MLQCRISGSHMKIRLDALPPKQGDHAGMIED